jgi:hypothetical protein
MGRKKYIQAEWMKSNGKNVLDQRMPLRPLEGAVWKVIEGRDPWKGNSPSFSLSLSLALSLSFFLSKKKFCPPMRPSWRKELLANNRTDTCETPGLSSHTFTQACYHPHSGFASSRSPWDSLIKACFSYLQFVLYFPQVHSVFQSDFCRGCDLVLPLLSLCIFSLP